jgi:hypothetical protein
MNLKPEYRTNEMIERLAKVGDKFSYQLRGPFNDTGYPIQITLQRSRFSGPVSMLMLLVVLELVGYSDCADLDTFYMGRSDQWKWDLRRWRREIREVVQMEAVR